MQIKKFAVPAAAGLVIVFAGCEPHGFTRGAAAITPVKAVAPPEEPAGVRKVTFKTEDGWTIVGDLYVPKGEPKGAVVLLHQRGGQASDWAPLSTALQKAGIEALAIDQRGTGRSVEGPGPTGSDAPWETGGDIAAAVATFNEVGYIGLAGASYGANNALIYAGSHGHQIRSLALFSPGTNYNGLNALEAAPTYSGSVAIYHDRGDEIANSGPAKIQALLGGRDHKLRLYPGSDHGTALLKPAVIADCVRFFQRTLR